jgi:dihydroflavonol-4-reductase
MTRVDCTRYEFGVVDAAPEHVAARARVLQAQSRAAIGASGLLEGTSPAEPCAKGHQVVATRRAGTKVQHLDDPPIEWVDAELSSIDALTRAFVGAATVFHCAAAVSVKREVTPEMTATNVTGTANVIEAVIAAKVSRLVHTSSVVAVGLSTNGVPCDETAQWNFEAEGLIDAYAITKRRAEEVVHAARDRVDAVIVNPTYMFGPRDAKPSSGKLIVDVVRGRVPGWTPGYNNFVDVRDVARGMIAAWQRGRRGERYILAGHDMTYGDVMREIARVAGWLPRSSRIPPRPCSAGRSGRAPRAADQLTPIRYAFGDRFRFRAARPHELGSVGRRARDPRRGRVVPARMLCALQRRLAGCAAPSSGRGPSRSSAPPSGALDRVQQGGQRLGAVVVERLDLEVKVRVLLGHAGGDAQLGVERGRRQLGQRRRRLAALGERGEEGDVERVREAEDVGDQAVVALEVHLDERGHRRLEERDQPCRPARRRRRR